ncbi:YhjD/YihY/BrkB family envelope integrity protein [Salinigranum sp.]|uniref:YhjD/YihY/BrkB family envelope integrity protein n=1 Tax=Salinigranum sp. TaxID=1966351 RepID=UPI00356577E4
MSVLGTGRSVVELVREEEVPFMAASIAYYAIASFVPLLILTLALLSVFGAKQALIDVLRSALSGSGSEVLNSVLSDMRGHGVAGVVGGLLALWSGIKVFRGLTVAFDELYSRQSELSLLDQLKKSVLALATLLVGFVLLSTLSVTLTFVDIPLQYPTLVGNVVAIVVLSAAFLPIFYIMPPVDVTVRHALPGAIVAAVGWVLLQIGFYYYAGSAGKYAAYGLLGALLLFITFLYLGAIVFLVGVVVNVALDL